jgi:hypothetical protein
MERKRPSQRKYEYRGRSDPRCRVSPYVEQFCEGSWSEVFAVTGWRPSRAVVFHRSELDAETLKWLAEFNRSNRSKF